MSNFSEMFHLDFCIILKEMTKENLSKKVQAVLKNQGVQAKYRLVRV